MCISQKLNMLSSSNLQLSLFLMSAKSYLKFRIIRDTRQKVPKVGGFLEISCQDTARQGIHPDEAIISPLAEVHTEWKIFCQPISGVNTHVLWVPISASVCGMSLMFWATLAPWDSNGVPGTYVLLSPPPLFLRAHYIAVRDYFC